MNIKKINEQIALLSKITEVLLKEAPKEVKYSKQFKELSKTSGDFRLPTFQKIYDDIKKAKNAMDSKKLQSLIKKFDKKWNFKVNRTRELVSLAQII